MLSASHLHGRDMTEKLLRTTLYPMASSRGIFFFNWIASKISVVKLVWNNDLYLFYLIDGVHRAKKNHLHDACQHFVERKLSESAGSPWPSRHWMKKISTFCAAYDQAPSLYVQVPFGRGFMPGSGDNLHFPLKKLPPTLPRPFLISNKLYLATVSDTRLLG